MTTGPATRVSRPVFARTFPVLSRAMEAGGMADYRDQLQAGLAGRVLEVGAGTGASFGHYPAAVAEVIAVEPEPRLRRLAVHAARPGGRLCFVEHVRAGSAGLARVQHVLDAVVWPHLFGGCHLGRDTGTAIEQTGFRIEQLDCFMFPEARTPVSFHIVGTAALDS